jgi:hypothetical protein
MYKLFIAVMAALMAGTAWGYPADLEIRPKGLNIGAIVHSDGRLAMVRITNQEATPLRCDAFFRNGPEQGRTRHAIVDSGDSATLSWMPRREVVRLRIQLNCEPHDGESNGEDLRDRDSEPRVVEPDDPPET